MHDVFVFFIPNIVAKNWVKILLYYRNNLVIDVIMIINYYISERGCHSFNLQCCFRNRARGSVPTFMRFLFSMERLTRWSCHSSCLWCIFPINYLHKSHTDSSPIMQYFSTDCQLHLLPISTKLHLFLASSFSPHRSLCSPGLTTWQTQSCSTWFLCLRASARRRTFTACYRAWGTGSRRQLQLALPASTPAAQRPHLAATALQLGFRPPNQLWGSQCNSQLGNFRQMIYYQI